MGLLFNTFNFIFIHLCNCFLHQQMYLNFTLDGRMFNYQILFVFYYFQFNLYCWYSLNFTLAPSEILLSYFSILLIYQHLHCLNLNFILLKFWTFYLILFNQHKIDLRFCISCVSFNCKPIGQLLNKDHL